MIKARIHPIRTTVGQERNVVKVLEAKVDEGKTSIASIFILPDIRGYVFVETPNREEIIHLTQGMRHVKGKPREVVSLDDISKHLVKKPTIELISEEDVVEIVSGPLRGMSGKVIRVDKSKKEVTIEISGAAYPLPLSVSVDNVRIVQSQKEGRQTV